jgi:hypothetical protein
MAQVILFGGGDGGGLLIGANGVRPIPPFDPALRQHLSAVASLVRSLASNATSRDHKELAVLTTKLANLAFGNVEAVVGPLASEHGLVFQDGDGGFTCGSTGHPPIPLPWPPPRSLGIADLVSNGVLERELATLFARSQYIDVKALLADPVGVADKAGIELSDRSLAQLSLLSPARVHEITDPVGREIVELFHKVVEDGRFLDRWARRPYETAAALGVKLSRDALDRIVAGGNAVTRPGMELANPAIVVGIVVVVIMLVPTEAGRVPQNILDRSNLVKF